MGYLQVFLQPGTTVVGWADRLSIAIVRYRFRTPGPRGKKKFMAHTQRDRQRERRERETDTKRLNSPVQASCAATGWGAPHMPTQTRRCTALTAKCDFGGGGGVAGVEGVPAGAECAERVSEHVLGGTPQHRPETYESIGILALSAKCHVQSRNKMSVCCCCCCCC